MTHNRNNQPEEHEESEYRFSDDEINYEVEEESVKPAGVAAAKKDFKLSNLKRIIISAVVFFVLVLIAYKMLSPPSTSTPEITAIPTPKPGSPIVAINKTIKPPAISQSNLPNLPNIDKTTAAMSAYQVPGQLNIPINGGMMGEIEARMAAMSVENEKRINQLTTDYNQKLSDFAAQNKQLQDQVQLLSTKIGSLETQMSQLIQVLIHQNPKHHPESGHASTDRATAESTDASPPPSSPISYNVQAIIPGRAWLKAENGETVTVAEGDMIKGLGRVTKIDPYDGIVEVNTGNKAVSLSYGSNG